MLFMCSCPNFFEISLFSISKEINQAEPEYMNIPLSHAVNALASPSILYCHTLENVRKMLC